MRDIPLNSRFAKPYKVWEVIMVQGMFFTKCALFLIVTAHMAVLIVGCNGNLNRQWNNGVNSTSVIEPVAYTFNQTGSVTIRVKWSHTGISNSSRLIPTASKSIRIQFLLDGTVIAEGIIVRPEKSKKFDNLPATDLLLRGMAYPNEDGTGVAQAKAEKDITVQPDKETTVKLVLESTIVKVEISPSPAEVVAGKTLQLTATAKDADGSTVMVATSGAFTWEVIKGGEYASVDSNGLVTGLKPGIATVQATEKESGVAGTVDVTVLAAKGKILFQDNFDSYKAGTFPDQKWQMHYEGLGKQYQVVDSSHFFSQPNSMKFQSKVGWVGSAGSQPLWDPKPYKVFVVYGKVMVKELLPDKWAHTVGGKEGSLASFNLLANRDHVMRVIFHCTDNPDVTYDAAIQSAGKILLQPYEAGKWYQIKIVLDTSTWTYDIWINGVLRGSSLPCMRKLKPNCIAIGAENGNTSTVWFDDIVAWGGQTGDVDVEVE